MINTFSAVILKGLLSSGEWYETPGQLYRAGQILEEVIPEIDAEPKRAERLHAVYRLRASGRVLKSPRMAPCGQDRTHRPQPLQAELTRRCTRAAAAA